MHLNEEYIYITPLKCYESTSTHSQNYCCISQSKHSVTSGNGCVGTSKCSVSHAERMKLLYCCIHVHSLLKTIAAFPSLKHSVTRRQWMLGHLNAVYHVLNISFLNLSFIICINSFGFNSTSHPVRFGLEK